MRSCAVLLLALSVLPGCLGPDAAAADDVDLEDLDPAGLHWISPLATDLVIANEGIEIGVYTQNTAARVVHFAIDGREIGVCDPTQPDEDCREEQASYYTAEIADAGHHVLSAWFDDAAGHRVSTTREIDVVDTAPSFPELTDRVDDTPIPEDSLDTDIEDETAHDTLGSAGTDLSPIILEGDSTIHDAITLRRGIGRGYLDPSHDWRSFGGGIRYRVSHQRVILDHARIDGSASRACRCQRAYHTEIAASADLWYVSRASVIAALVAGDNCNTDPGSVASVAFMRGRTCTSVARAAQSPVTPAPGHTAEWTCRHQMATDPSFAASVVAGYLSRPSVAQRHLFDPPRMAAVISTGSVRRSHLNRWHMYSRGDWISRYVGAYNAFRTQEHGGDPDVPASFDSPYNARLPNTVGGNRARRTTAAGCANGAARTNEACERWPITGNPPLRNGFGDDRAVVTDTYVMINFGQRRMMRGEPHVYAFAAHVRDPGGATGLASGWIPEAAVTDRTITSMPTVNAPDPGGTYTAYTLVGAPMEYSYWDPTPGLSRDMADRKVRTVYGSGGDNASDYYTRRTFASEPGLVNILYGLPGHGGVSDDTIPVSTSGRVVHFYAADAVPTISSYLYPACSATSDARLPFVYGYVDTPFGRRYGWVARANLM